METIFGYSKKGSIGKFILYSIISAIIFLLIYSLWFNSTTTGQGIKLVDKITSKVISSASGSINLEDFNKNPENYVGKNVSATGKYENYIARDYGCGRGTTLVDSDKGYELPFCPLNNPDIRFEVGETYTIKGTIKKFEMQNFLLGSINSITGLYEYKNVTYYVLMED